MSNKVYLVTSPDDLLIDGTRILLVDLTIEQSKIVSDALTSVENIPNLIVYVWKETDELEWMFDKKHKADLIIFNADSNDQTVVGYMAAQQGSCYFGTLRSVSIVNKTAIYNTDDCIRIIENLLNI